MARQLQNSFNNPSQEEVQSFVQAAASCGDRQTITAFIQKYPAAVDEKFNSFTALMMAAWWGNIDIAEQLLEKTTALNERDQWGRTALMSAALWKHKDVVELLLEKGARIDGEDNQGKTAVMLADDPELVALIEQAIEKRAAEAAAKAAEEERIKIVSDPHLRRDIPRPKPLCLSPKNLP